MKNQYFGDENDYKKYGLLNTLTGRGELRTVVCWMLTPDDSGPDGRFTDYLSQPDKWRCYNPPLYDHLGKAVVALTRRDVQYAADVNLIPGARYYDPLLLDDREGREAYWRSFWHLAEGCTLVFFDPDNGLEVKSKPYGRKDSSKYLYWDELSQTLNRGYSALVYQHFSRVARDAFITQRAQEMHQRTSTGAVYSFRTNRVVFFLLLQSAHVPRFEKHIAQVERVWSGQIVTREHLCT